ncbi:MAG: hypothetical protein L0Y39_02210 [Methylococcaceae bacterium]|nr:hypothetical protein [Methylococcaceae bacterium]
MGVFNGLIMLGIGLWFHYTVIQQNQPLPEPEKENAIKWFAIGSLTFLAGVIVGLGINWLIVEGFIGGMAVGIGGEFGRTSGGDTGLQAIVLEFFPLTFGLLAAYLVRVRYILKKDLGISKLIKKFTSKTK